MSENETKTSKRLISLDAFRGFTIAGMILVNTPGSWAYIFPPLRHAEWNGLTPTDLVFPFFLFIVGVSIVLAYTKRLKSMAPKSAMLRKIFFRTLILFALGVLLNLIGSNFESLRLPGVLQRISIVFLFCSLLFLYTNIRLQIWTAVVLLAGYYLLMIGVDVPGIGTGVLEPGQNLAAWIDSKVIPFSMWQGTWDPEGILSTLPAIGTGITGMLAGHVMISARDLKDKVILLLIAGFAAALLGEMWGWIFPINKNLWTSSYVLFTSGLATMTWAGLIWTMEVRDHKKWAHWGVVFGMNAITVYVLSSLLLLPFTHIPISQGKSLQTLYMQVLTDAGMMPELASMIWAILFVGLCFIPAWLLYRKRIFIKI